LGTFEEEGGVGGRGSEGGGGAFQREGRDERRR